MLDISNEFMIEDKNYRPLDSLSGKSPINYRLINANNVLRLEREIKLFKEGNCNPVVFS
jgi:hypothetical protein